MRKSLYRRHNQVFLGLLRRYREQGKFRQRDLAQHLGSVQGTVSKAETGTRRLDVIELREWLLAMGVDFVEFMTELHQQLEAVDTFDLSLIGVPPQKPAQWSNDQMDGSWGDTEEARALAGSARLAAHRVARRTLVQAHLAGLARMLVPLIRTALTQEVADTLEDLGNVQVRGRTLTQWLGKPVVDVVHLLQPSDEEVRINARELAELLLSNWTDLLSTSSREADLLQAVMHDDKPSVPIEAMTGCLAFPVSEEEARRVFATYLRHHWSPATRD